MKLSHTKTLFATLALAFAAGAHAFPIANPNNAGYAVVVATTGDVYATFEGVGADVEDSDNLYLQANGVFIFNNHTTPVGTTVNLGSFAAGTELVFRMRNTTKAYDYYSGAASRNPDGHAHASVDSDYLVAGTTLMSFEDLLNGPYDYNDLSFSFTNTVSLEEVPPTPTNVPEPSSIALLGLGLLALSAKQRLLKK